MKKFLLLFTLVLSIFIISCDQNLYLDTEKAESPENIWRVGTVYFDTADKAIEYIMTSSSLRTVTKTDDEARTITLTRPVLSEGSDGIKDDSYKAYVESDSLRGSITVPASFSGDLCIDFNGYRYDFSNNAEAFFVVSGGDNVYIYNGTSVIYNEASHVPYAMVVDTDTVTIDEHMIDDRRVDPKAVDVKADGSVVITSSSENSDTSLKGGLKVDGTLKIDSGTVYIDSIKTAETSSFEITGGTIITTSDCSEVVKNAIQEEEFKKNNGEYEVSKDVVVDTETTISSSITPANASSSASDERETVVTIPANTKELTSGASASLTVTAYPILEANKKFISGYAGAVGAIDLKVRITTRTENGTTTKDVTSFTSDGTTAVAVTVETYLAKGMSNVTLEYNNDTATETWKATATSATEGLTLPDGNTAGICYYDATTGKLVFKTTDFSMFLVWANENVYDKSTNTAYTLSSDGKIKDKDYIEKAVANLGSSLVLLDCALSNNVLDEWIKSYDNADGKTWTVIHHNCSKVDSQYSHKQVKGYFASGYGTKVEPYIIENREQFQNISDISEYSYFKWNGEATINAKNWDYVDLCGSFDGNNLEIESLDAPLFGSIWNGLSDYHPGNDKTNTYTIENIKIKDVNNVSSGWNAAVAMVVGVDEFVMKNVEVHGKIEGSYGVAAFVCFGPGNFTSSDEGWVYDGGTITFENCTSDIEIVAKSGNAVGFVAHAMMSDKGKITLKDSTFNGKVSGPYGGYKYACGNYTSATIEDNKKVENENNGVYNPNVNGWEYTLSGKTGSISIENKKISDFEISVGNVISVDAVENATKAKIELQISPNPGCMTATYLTENVETSDNKFTSGTIKYFTIRINPDNISTSVINGNYYDVVNTNYNKQIGANTVIRFTQYDTNDNVLKVTNISLEDMTTVNAGS